MDISQRTKTWTLVAVLLGIFMLLLDVTIVIVALPDIQHSLGAKLSDIQWMVDAYALSLAALLLPTGSLADDYGRRRVFAIGLTVFTLGSLLCGAAQSPGMLIASRVLQGVGGATIFSTSLALLAQTFHGRERGTAFAAYGAVAGISTALGPLFGGMLTTWLNWRWIFLVNLPVGIFAIVVTLMFVQESRAPQRRKIDIPGFVVFTLGLLALVYGLIRASEHSWSEHLVVGSLVVGAVLLVAFPIIEHFTAEPMFDLELFRNRTFVGGLVAAFGMNGSLFAMFLYLVLYMQNQLHLDSLQSGLRLMVVTVATLVTAIPAGRLSAHMSVRWLIGPGLIIVGVGLFLMHGVKLGSDWTHLIPGFIVAGLGSGLVNAPLASTAVGVVKPQQAGIASGINSTFRQVGIAASIAAFGSILATRLRNAHGHDIPSTYISSLNELLLIAGVIAVVAGVLALLLIRQSDFAHHGAGDAAPAAAH